MAAARLALSLFRAQQLTNLRSFHPAALWMASPSQSGRQPAPWARSLGAAAGGTGGGGGGGTASDGVLSSSNGNAATSGLADGEEDSQDSNLEAAIAAQAMSGGAEEPPLDAGLYLVSTPIGNLEDITLRALRVLRTASCVLAEDTRHTRQLFARYGIRTPLHSYHQHNERQKEALILRQLQQGAAIALVSDAGTPAINDPGASLVAAAAAAGLPVIPIPGPSAVLAAVVASGLPTDQFLYSGFTAPKPSARRKQFARLAAQEATLVFFVSPHSLLAALADAAEVLGAERRCCLARELTKRHEEFWRGTLAEAAAEFAERGPRGEFVLLLEGANGSGAAAGGEGAAAGQEAAGEEQIVAALREAVAAGESPSSAAKSVAQRLGANRKLVYRLSLDLGQEAGGQAA